MLPCYLFNHLHIFHLFLIVLAVWCFNEPCLDDSSCSKQGFQCRFGHCLCPSDEFWSGNRKHCIPCPNKWINLLVFCIYYEYQMLNWLVAEKVCEAMTNTINQPVRLLELNDLNDFDFIQKSIRHILTDDQMKIEINIINRVLSSATAFVGSQGQRIRNKDWSYRWESRLGKTYTNTSQMWCQEKYWHTITFQREPAWENDERIERTFQALKRWSDSNDACLVSLLPDNQQPFLCEIVGEPGRVDNQSILPFLLTTMTSTLVSTTRKQTDLLSSTTTKQQPTITDLVSLTITQPSSFSNTTSMKLNLTNDQTDLKQKGLLYIIIGILGIVILIIIFIVIINIQYKKKEPSINSKFENKRSLTHSKTNEKYTEDIQSNASSESHLSAETSTQKSLESHRIYTDKQSLTPSTSKSIKPAKLALWDQMESSLFSSTLHEPIKRQLSSSSN